MLDKSEGLSYNTNVVALIRFFRKDFVNKRTSRVVRFPVGLFCRPCHLIALALDVEFFLGILPGVSGVILTECLTVFW